MITLGRTLDRGRYLIPGAFLTSTFLFYGLYHGDSLNLSTRFCDLTRQAQLTTISEEIQSPYGYHFTPEPTDDPAFPRSAFDMQPGKWLADHAPVKVEIIEGYWISQALSWMWSGQYTCQSGLKVISRWDNQKPDYSSPDVILTLSQDPGFRWNMDRSKTKLAFLGMEPYHYDVNVDETFDIKASVYQSEMGLTWWRGNVGPEDPRHVWTTYSEFPWRQYLEPKALPNWNKLDKSRAVMFVSSNSCPQHRSNFVHELVKRGLDVWSFGTCASEHENSDRISQLKELCGDGALWSIPDWRKAKECVTEHFKFIISIENSLGDDYVSEKFFHPFGIGAVPLYWGPKNIDVYSPGPNSFVNLRDFGVGMGHDDDTPDYDGIIEMIEYYNNNDTEYDKFFDWKRNRQFNPGFAEVNYRSWNNLVCTVAEKSVEMDEKGIPWGNARQSQKSEHDRIALEAAREKVKEEQAAQAAQAAKEAEEAREAQAAEDAKKAEAKQEAEEAAKVDKAKEGKEVIHVDPALLEMDDKRR